MNKHIKHLGQIFTRDTQPQKMVNLWVPSELVVVHTIPAPTAPKRKWLELVPWLLEDKLLLPAEETHFILADTNTADNTLSVFTVAKKTMEAWIKQAQHAELQHYTLLADFLALPFQDGSISITVQDNNVIVRNANFDGFSASKDIAWLLVDSFLANTNLTISAYTALDNIPDYLHEKVNEHSLAFDWQLAKAIPSCNLLSGEYKQKNQDTKKPLWWSIAAVLFLSIGLCLGYYYLSPSEPQTSVRQNYVTNTQVVQPSNTTRPESSSAANSNSTTPATSRPQRSNIRIELLGIIHSDNLSAATLKVDGKTEKVFYVGDEFESNVELSAIFADGIEINDHGETREFFMVKNQLLTSNQGATAQSIISTTNDDGFSMANMFSAVPIQVNNYDSGLKLDNLSEELKMLTDVQEGDVLVQVGSNGIQELLSDPQLWTNYSANTELPVTIIRNGEELTLTVNAFSLSVQFLPNLASELIP